MAVTNSVTKIKKELKSMQDRNDLEAASDFVAKQESDQILHVLLESGWFELIHDCLRDDNHSVHDNVESFLAADRRGNFPLHTAVRMGSDVLNEALLAGVTAGLFETSWDLQGTPLMYAAGTGNTASVRLLLQAGGDPDQRFLLRSGNWVSAIETAVYKGFPDIARQLLDAGADSTLVNTEWLRAISDETDVIDQIAVAAKMRNGMSKQRYRMAEVFVDAGEARFVMPAQLEEAGDVYNMDVLGDVLRGLKRRLTESDRRLYPKSAKRAEEAEQNGAQSTVGAEGADDLISGKIGNRRKRDEIDSTAAPKHGP